METMLRAVINIIVEIFVETTAEVFMEDTDKNLVNIITQIIKFLNQILIKTIKYKKNLIAKNFSKQKKKLNIITNLSSCVKLNNMNLNRIQRYSKISYQYFQKMNLILRQFQALKVYFKHSYN